MPPTRRLSRQGSAVSDEHLPIKIALWLWDNAAAGICGAVAVWIGTQGLQKLTAAVKSSHTHLLKSIRRLAKWLKLRELKLVRKYRLDLAWIGRETIRGYAYLTIMIVLFGLWITAIGMREALGLADALQGSSTIALILATPLYAFEIHWIICSTRVSKLIKYRQKVRIWRWR